MRPSVCHCRLVIPLLSERSGRETTVILSENRRLTVSNIILGDDLDDPFEHITSNISPPVDNATVELFFTDEVARIIDPTTGERLWENDGPPNVR